MNEGEVYRITLAKSETSNCSYEGVYVGDEGGFLTFKDCFWVNADVPEKTLFKFNKRFIVKIEKIGE